MTAEILLSRLEKVRQIRPDYWKACCPVHGDHHPSLSIRETQDGTVLLRCFSHECAVPDIVAAVGLTMSDLFPERLENPANPKRSRRDYFPAVDVLRAIAFEVLVVEAAAGTIQARGYLNDREAERLIQATERLHSAISLAGVDQHGH
jgi:hypothetical protein